MSTGVIDNKPILTLVFLEETASVVAKDFKKLAKIRRGSLITNSKQSNVG